MEGRLPWAQEVVGSIPTTPTVPHYRFTGVAVYARQESGVYLIRNLLNGKVYVGSAILETLGGKPKSPKHRQGIGLALKGRVFSEAHREKLKQAALKQWASR